MGNKLCSKPESKPIKIIVLGVSGVGKSTVANALLDPYLNRISDKFRFNTGSGPDPVTTGFKIIHSYFNRWDVCDTPCILKICGSKQLQSEFSELFDDDHPINYALLYSLLISEPFVT